MKTKTFLLGSLFSFSLGILPAEARPVIAIRGVNELIQFDSATPGTISSAVFITGLVSGDEVKGLDFRPTTGVLYALGINGTTGRIYTLNPTTAVATQVGSAPFSTALSSGTSWGFDFNPVADLLRVVNGSDQNLRVHPDTGALVATDSNINNATDDEEVVGVAYDRNDRNPGTPTTLLGIDFRNDQLVRIGGEDGDPSPNLGAVANIGSLGLITQNGNIGFDIPDGAAGPGFVSAADNTVPTRYRFYSINLGTGALTPLGLIGTGVNVIASLTAFPTARVTNVNTGEFFGTIQAAVNDAQTLNGHTIAVNAGTFSESVSVTKQLTFLGARAGIDAREPFRDSSESVVQGPAGTNSFNVTANNVTIDGFVVQENTNTGIVLGPGTIGAKIRNNIIRNNVTGMYLSGNAPKNQLVIERNLFQANNKSGVFSGIAVYSDQTTSGGTLLNVVINDNTFINNTLAAVSLSSTTAASQSRIVISNNIVSASGNGLLLFNTTDSVISRNQFTGSTGSQVVFGGGVNRISMTENHVIGGDTRGIRIGDFGGGSANTNIVATCNDIQNNAGAGLEISDSYTGTLDATGNWWGSATGPTIASNPGGTGEDIVDLGGQVNYSGFLLSGTDPQFFAPGFQCYPSTLLYALEGTNNLIRFDSSLPEVVLGSVAITGLQPGETLLGIDFRPTTGELFTLGRIASGEGRLYVINKATGAATLRAVLTAAPGDDNPYTTLTSGFYGLSFNPVPDLAGNPSLRVVNSGDQNLRINVTNGQVTTDTPIQGVNVQLRAVAYGNNDLDPATGTTLSGYDYTADAFVDAPNPNSGIYNPIGFSGIVAASSVDFDIQTLPNARNIPFASLEVAGSPLGGSLYVVNLANGLMIPLGEIGSSLTINGLAVAPAGAFGFSAVSYSVGESGPTASITVNRIGGSEGNATVRFRTADGTANAPADYTSVDQFVLFASGESSKVVSIPFVNDSEDEFNETVNLSLSEPTGGALLAAGFTTATLTITDNDLATPILTTQPSSPTAAVGEAMFDTATISGGVAATGTITFQLFGPNDTNCGGAPIFTSVVQVNGNGNYISQSFVPTTPGNYQWVVTYSGDADHNTPVSTGCGAPNQTIGVTATTLGNISTRLRVETGDNVLIGGFIITGTQPKRVMVRAIGPSLSQFFSGVLENPTLELYQGNTLLMSNDDWRSDQESEIIGTTIPPTNDRESAIVISLPANSTNYTAVVRGFNGGTGIGVVEAYDLDRLVDSELANISTRGFVQTDDNVLIAGTIVVGQSPQRVLIRAIGPSLAQFFSGVLANPTMELRDANGTVLQANDNWVDSADKQAIIDTATAPTNDLESAILAVLPANNARYTAIVRGVNNATGIAVVEVYALD